MNFKIFQAAQQEKQTPKARLKAKKIFFEQIQNAIDSETIYDFIEETFEEYNMEKIGLLASFYEEYDFSKSRSKFFYVFDAICRNIYFLDDSLAKNIIQMIVETYYVRHIYKVKDIFKIVENDNMSLLRYLMSRLPATLLEEVVLSNYSDIVGEIKLEDVKFMTTYVSWRRKISEHFKTFMYLMDGEFDNFVDFANTFPEYAPSVYEYIFLCILGESENDYGITCTSDFDLIQDLLQPMADFEKYQGYYFECIRKYAVSILDYAENCKLMYDVANLLNEDFGISTSLIDTAINIEADSCIDYISECLTKNPHSSYQNSTLIFEILNDLFGSSKAYNRFMNELPDLLETCGIVLYSILLCLLGPIPELVSKQSLCVEYSEK